MTIKEGRMGLTGLRHAQSKESVSGNAIDQAIDETIQRYFMRHEPPARAYTRLFEVAQRPSASRRDGRTVRSWIVGVSSASAAVLLVNLALQLLGVTTAYVAADAAGPNRRFLVWLSSTSFARWVNESETIFGYFGILFLHTLGLAVVVGVSIVLDLRLLGAASRISVPAMRPLFRFLWWGFAVNALSGAMLFAADAPRKAANPVFELKLALIAVAVAMMAAIERRMLHAELGGSTKALKALAIASLLVWVAAIAAGRLVAYAL